MKIGRERLRQLLVDNDITFQRTKTWKESNDPDRDAKLDRIEEVLEHHPDRTFAFDEFGPHPTDRRVVLGTQEPPATAAGELSPAPRSPPVPWLLLGRR